MNRFHRLLRLQFKLHRQGGVICNRLAHYINSYINFRYHCDIPNSIDPTDLFFCHNGLNIVINPNTKIGSKTYIQHGVTIGVRDDIKSCKAPVIGNGCYIGAKATIIGDIRIGDNCKIGAGALVISDIPSGCTAVGVPAKIVNKRHQ